MNWIKKFLTFGLLTIGIAIAPIMANTISVSAASSLTVNNLGDSTPGKGNCPDICTLRAAIEKAEKSQGAWTITVPAGTINLTYGQLILKARNSPGTLNLTIVGAGNDLTIIDAGMKSRGFFFGHFSGVITLQGLTVKHANNIGGSSKNSDPAGSGGAIYNETDLTLNDVTLSDSQANQGGGIFTQFAAWFTSNQPILHLNSVAILRNTATSKSLGEGGGGLFNGSSLVGDGVTISGNYAQQGGGFYNNSFDPNVSLNNFTISGNTSINGSGGGIDNDLGIITLTNGSISQNTSNCCDVDSSGNPHNAGGAGIYANASAEFGLTSTITLDGVTVNGNVANGLGSFGGGIQNSQKMTIRNSAILVNRADYGAGIQNGNQVGQVNELVMTNSTISTNVGVVSASLDTEGGGLRNMGGQATLTNVTVTNNSAEVGGGISSTGGALVLKNSIVAQNIGSYGYPLILRQPDCRGVITSGGYNLVGDKGFTPANYPVPCTFNPTTGDQIGGDPLLDVLTTTPPYLHPLKPGSPAIDSANISPSVCPSVDQRGMARPQGNGCDKGAYEVEVNFRLTSIDYTKGKPGSIFTITGSSFSAQSSLTLYLNGVALSPVSISSQGSFILQLDSTRAAEGKYALYPNDGSAAPVFMIWLSSQFPLDTPGPQGTRLPFPAGVKPLTKDLFLPIMKR